MRSILKDDLHPNYSPFIKKLMKFTSRVLLSFLCEKRKTLECEFCVIKIYKI